MLLIQKSAEGHSANAFLLFGSQLLRVECSLELHVVVLAIVRSGLLEFDALRLEVCLDGGFEIIRMRNVEFHLVESSELVLLMRLFLQELRLPIDVDLDLGLEIRWSGVLQRVPLVSWESHGGGRSAVELAGFTLSGGRDTLLFEEVETFLVDQFTIKGERLELLLITAPRSLGKRSLGTHILLVGVRPMQIFK